MERFVTETISWHPEEIYFTLMLWQQSCETWPDFRCWTILLYLPCSHKVMLTCVANRLKRMRWFWLEGRAAATHADGLMPYRESRLVEVGYESLCQQHRRGGVRSNEERHFLLYPPPLSHIWEDWKPWWIHTSSTNTLLWVHFSSHSQRNKLSLVRETVTSSVRHYIFGIPDFRSKIWLSVLSISAAQISDWFISNINVLIL